MVVPMHFDPSTTEDEIAHRLTFPAERGRLWRAGTAKFFLDGVMESGTAWQVEPGPGVPTRRRSGPTSTATGTCAALHRGGLCLHHPRRCRRCRAGGPRRVRGGGPAEDRHAPRRAHRDAPRRRPAPVRQLGVAASMQPLHMGGLDRGEPAAWFDGLAPGDRAWLALSPTSLAPAQCSGWARTGWWPTTTRASAWPRRAFAASRVNSIGPRTA